MDKLEEEGCTEASVACTHGLFTGKAVERLRDHPAITEVVTTDTVPAPDDWPELQVRTVSPAVRRGDRPHPRRRVGLQPVRRRRPGPRAAAAQAPAVAPPANLACSVRRVAALSDVGGRPEFFGTIDREVDEPVFHDPWEGRVFGMSVYVQSLFGPNTDAARSQMEQLPGEVFWSSYYRRWLGGLERRLVHDGYLGEDEVDARVDGREPAIVGRRAPRGRRAVTSAVLRRLARPTLPTGWPAHVLPRALGNSRPIAPAPAVLRRRRGPRRHRADTRAHPQTGLRRRETRRHHGSARSGAASRRPRRAATRCAAPLHGRLRRHRLWGDAAEPGTEVRIDLFEPYLETP